MKQSKIVVIAIACMFAGIAFVVGLGLVFYRFVVQGTKTGPPTEEEMRLVLDAEAFDRLADDLDPACRSSEAIRYFDGSREIEHKYECAGEGGLRVISMAEVQRTTSNAIQSYALLLTGYKGGVRIGGGRLDPQPELLRLGDQHYAGVVRKDGDPVGNVFVLREGKVVHSLILTGVYLDDPEFVQELFEPLVKEARRYR